MIKKILRNMYLIIKRIFDFIVSAILLVILFVPFLIVAIAIKAEDKGPIFFKQIRIGKNIKTFKMYKFRSMKIETPNIATNLYI